MTIGGQFYFTIYTGINMMFKSGLNLRRGILLK